MRKVIVNSTPLISLAKINKLDILKQLYSKVYVPYGVYEEVCISGNTKIGNDIFRNSDFLCIEKISNEDGRKYFQTSLHKGEVEVMILGNELKADLLIIDDLLARKYAKYLGFTITGTLGVLIKAKEKKIIDNVRPLIDSLISNGIYIDDKLYKQVIKITNEEN